MELHEIELRKARLIQLIEVARRAGLVETQKDFAELIGMNENSVSRAKKGDPACLSDSFFIKIENAFNRAGISMESNSAPIQQGDGNTMPANDIQCLIGEMAAQRQSYESIIKDLISKIK